MAWSLVPTQQLQTRDGDGARSVWQLVGIDGATGTGARGEYEAHNVERSHGFRRTSNRTMV